MAETVVPASVQVLEDGQSVSALVERRDARAWRPVGQSVGFKPILYPLGYRAHLARSGLTDHRPTWVPIGEAITRAHGP